MLRLDLLERLAQENTLSGTTCNVRKCFSLDLFCCLVQENTLRPVRVANGRQPGDTSGNEQLGPLHMLLFGALSGASAEAVVYPMEVIRRRMQMKAASAGVSPCPAVHRNTLSRLRKEKKT